MGKKGENREYREEMLAVMEKEVMAVSLLCRELTPTLLQVSQQETSGSIREEAGGKIWVRDRAASCTHPSPGQFT